MKSGTKIGSSSAHFGIAPTISMPTTPVTVKNPSNSGILPRLACSRASPMFTATIVAVLQVKYARNWLIANSKKVSPLGWRTS
jgi:hypothetical protein